MPQTLPEIAKRVPGGVRESDIVARLGGDEFVVLLPAINTAQDALLVAEKIHHAFEQSFELAGHSLQISASAGIALYPEHGGDAESLLKSTDIAMYRAKQDGRNNTRLYRPEMQKSGE